jgi:anti-sigma B factor antagonist
MLSDAPLTFDMTDGKPAGTRIFRLDGPITLRNFFDFQASLRTEPHPGTTVLDMSGVPYMDSAGMGAIVNFYVHCQKEGTQLVVAGVSDRVMELFKLTKVDTVIPIRASCQELKLDA